MRNVRRWVVTVSAAITAVTMAVAASAQTPTAPAPKAPASKLAACNTITEEAACRKDTPRCQWVSGSTRKDKAGKEIKTKAYCRTTPVRKKADETPAKKSPPKKKAAAPAEKAAPAETPPAKK